MSFEPVVRSVAGRLSLRAPQRESLERLNRSLALAPDALKHGERDLPAILAQLQAAFPTLTDFEREFPSLCFALATGVGKTRLMGAFISYLYLSHGIQNFFVLAPNLTIYDKLIADFTPNTPKYVFKGIAEFATAPPEIITGDNYEQRAAQVQGGLLSPVTINIFNSQQPEYVPDFVAETTDRILMCETKARADMADSEVQAKATAARKWCAYATDFSRSIGGKAWEYLLIPHDEVQENRSLDYFRAIAGGH